MTLEEIQQATTRDKTLQCVVHLMRNQGWKDLNSLPDERQEADLSELRQFNRVQHELTVEYYSTQKSDSDPIRITGKSCIACTSGTPRNCQNQTSTPREGLVPQHWQVCQRKHWQMHCLSSKQSWEQTGSFAICLRYHQLHGTPSIWIFVVPSPLENTGLWSYMLTQGFQKWTLFTQPRPVQ